MTEQKQYIDSIEQEATKRLVAGPIGEVMYRTWQPWGDQMGGELVVMLHGGSGSWTHWIRNVSRLSDYYELLLPDLPGLGDSSSLPKDTTPAQVADLLATTLKQMVGPRRFHLIAFSWGAAVASLAAPGFAEQVKSIMLIGPASTGKPPEKSVMKPLIGRNSTMDEAQVLAADRENLGRLMIYDRARIDLLAVEIHNQNLNRARYNSPKHAMTELVLEGLAQTKAKLLVLCGKQDTVTVPNMAWREAQIKSARPDAEFEVVPGVGHWLQYEQADWFNQRAVNWIEANIFA